MLSFVPEKPHGASRILFWNVEDFGSCSTEVETCRAKRLVDIFNKTNPNVILLAEITHDSVLPMLLELMPQFKGEQFPLARRKKQGVALVDPSAQIYTNGIAKVVLQVPSGNVSIIPYHAKSGVSADDYEDRQQEIQIYHQHALKASVDGPTILIGDFNTMGNGNKISGAEEVGILRQNMAGFACIEKTQYETWMGVDDDACYPNGNFDHAFISEAHIVMLDSHKIYVGGWPNFSDFSEREAWVRQYSDHAFLILDIR
jgi:hypothetical protein